MNFVPATSEERASMNGEATVKYLERLDKLHPEEYASEMRVRLLELRDEYTEEIPAQIVRSDTPKYKCRIGWFATIIAEAENLKKRSMLSEGLVKKLNAFHTEVSPQIKQRLTTEQDIARGNLLLNEILKELELRYGNQQKAQTN